MNKVKIPINKILKNNNKKNQFHLIHFKNTMNNNNKKKILQHNKIQTKTVKIYKKIDLKTYQY